MHIPHLANLKRDPAIRVLRSDERRFLKYEAMIRSRKTESMKLFFYHNPYEVMK